MRRADRSDAGGSRSLAWVTADPTTVYTDGACLGNPGPGGWAWAVPDGPFASGAEPATTNQRMEITAAWEAVRALPGPLLVLSDSTYVVNCFRDRWWEGWLRRGWTNSKKQPVANRDLWEPFVREVAARGDVTFRWVKGHSGDRWNDVVDRLAVEAAETQQGRAGDRPPPDLGAADTPDGPPRRRARRGVRRPDPPSGHRVAVLGHKPPQLGGYDPDNPVARAVRRRLTEALAAHQELAPDLVLLTGLQLGAEQLAAEAARDTGVPYVAVLPFEGIDARWPTASRARFRALLDGARDRVVLEDDAPDNPQAFGAAMRRRDAWLADAADAALLVWDGQDRALERAYKTLEERTDGQVLLVHPDR